MTNNEIFHGMNESQIQAITSTEGPLLVIAGPGTGKTLTIVRRIAYLLSLGVKPEEIVALTFTNRAAKEMRERVEIHLGYASSRIFLGTFHLFGLTILRKLKPTGFQLYDRDEQVELVRTISGCSARKAQDATTAISSIKNFMEDAKGNIIETFNAYETALREKNAYDLDDLIRIPVELFTNDDMAKSYARQLSYIMIDEYQDINPAQYRLIRCLSNFTTNICAVGDSDQAIYSFRGANLDNFLDFGRDFNDFHTVTLTENYRSSKTIVYAAEAMIANNTKRIEKKLNPTKGYGVPVTVINVENERSEADTIIGEIETRMGAVSHFNLMKGDSRCEPQDNSYRFSDFAVLFRTNAQAKPLHEAFVRSGIPCQMVGEKNNISLKGIIKRLKAEPEDLSNSDNLESILEDAFSIVTSDEFFGLERNLFLAYKNLSVPEAVSRIIDELELFNNADAFDPRADAVALMTLHMAKGLEFKVVFIAGFEDGIIPLVSARGCSDYEEERRLFYVGMTRARDKLFLIHAENRTLYGKRLDNRPSPFLKEIPEAFIRQDKVTVKRNERKKPKQQTLF